jgi:hypothetical protein
MPLGRRPMPTPDTTERSLECQVVLRSMFFALESVAVAAGWTEDEAAFALFGLAVANLKQHEADLGTDEAIARVLKAVGEPNRQAPAPSH